MEDWGAGRRGGGGFLCIKTTAAKLSCMTVCIGRDVKFAILHSGKCPLKKKKKGRGGRSRKSPHAQYHKASTTNTHQAEVTAIHNERFVNLVFTAPPTPSLCPLAKPQPVLLSYPMWISFLSSIVLCLIVVPWALFYSYLVGIVLSVIIPSALSYSHPMCFVL